jgi:uncharacterized protein YaaN involved in tellurite resistance
MTTQQATSQTSNGLQVATVAEVKQAISLGDPTVTETDPELDAKADRYVDALMAIDPKDYKARDEYKNATETMGLELQKQAARKSEMLKQPVRKIADSGAEGGSVAKSLLDLKIQVEALDPGKLDFEAGWFTRFVGQIPGIGTPLKRYFSKFESAQTVIAAIVRSLEQGRDQLQRDNVTLNEDQKMMYELTVKLAKAIRLAQRIDQKLELRLRDLAPGSEMQKFIAEELLFPLRQRAIDLQQQLAVNQQGVLASELIMRNNKELVRGVNRALNVTVSALNVGATVAIALANQKTVLDQVESVNKTTSDLIAGTAERLKTQGTQIHKQAASAQISLDSLKTAFADLRIAMDDLASFRSNALPQMAQTVLELDRMTGEATRQIEKMDRGNRAKPAITIEVE